MKKLRIKDDFRHDFIREVENIGGRVRHIQEQRKFQTINNAVGQRVPTSFHLQFQTFTVPALCCPRGQTIKSLSGFTKPEQEVNHHLPYSLPKHPYSYGTFCHSTSYCFSLFNFLSSALLQFFCSPLSTTD